MIVFLLCVGTYIAISVCAGYTNTHHLFYVPCTRHPLTCIQPAQNRPKVYMCNLHKKQA